MTATLTAPTDTPTIPRTGAPDRAELLAALRTFVCQRPGVEAGNYDSPRSFWREMDSIVKDRRDALAMLAAVERSSIDAPAMLAELQGRLHWDPVYREIDYTTGQYFAVEYRRAVCRFAATVLWHYWRECLHEAHEHGTADDIRAEAKRTFRSRRIWQYFR